MFADYNNLKAHSTSHKKIPFVARTTSSKTAGNSKPQALRTGKSSSPEMIKKTNELKDNTSKLFFN